MTQEQTELKTYRKEMKTSDAFEREDKHFKVEHAAQDIE